MLLYDCLYKKNMMNEGDRSQCESTGHENTAIFRKKDGEIERALRVKKQEKQTLNYQLI